MRDGRTRRVHSSRAPGDFLARNRASLTRIDGPASGSEYELEGGRVLIGRSRAAGVRLDEPSVSHEHASVELGSRGFGIRDLASTNGLRVNGDPVDATPLEHGDRIQIGSCELQYVVESRAAQRSWRLQSA